MYVSYFQFFSEMKAVINDLCIDMKLGSYTQALFDVAYNKMLTRITNRCQRYSEEFFDSKSKLVALFVSDVKGTKDYPQADRLDKLQEIVENYIRKSV